MYAERAECLYNTVRYWETACQDSRREQAFMAENMADHTFRRCQHAFDIGVEYAYRSAYQVSPFITYVRI